MTWVCYWLCVNMIEPDFLTNNFMSYALEIMVIAYKE